jgi:ketosteroid isomerase-like protein
MSEENLRIAREVNAAFNAGDFERWSAFLDPDMVYFEQPGTPLDTAEVLRGREQIRQSVTAYRTEFDDFHSDIDELIDAGDKLVCIQRWTGKGRESGIPIELQEIIVYTFRDGRIIEGRVYPDRASAIEAAGLRE